MIAEGTGPDRANAVDIEIVPGLLIEETGMGIEIAKIIGVRDTMMTEIRETGDETMETMHRQNQEGMIVAMMIGTEEPNPVALRHHNLAAPPLTKQPFPHVLAPKPSVQHLTCLSMSDLVPAAPHHHPHHAPSAKRKPPTQKMARPPRQRTTQWKQRTTTWLPCRP